ncbi:hypothetical protein MTR_2g060570 [Medicago truncatula]|uniref:Uncharacterized protein n=1 Tax=Medicago truncatula TaxID=3880 RepID=G7IGT6_MEDTR|nr:hypothetical protein MTR_2g060570 [Medicago truncatula]
MVVHHPSSFIFHTCPVDKLLLRNRLVRSLLRDYAGKQHEACDGNSSLQAEVNKSKDAGA